MKASLTIYMVAALVGSACVTAEAPAGPGGDENSDSSDEAAATLTAISGKFSVPQEQGQAWFSYQFAQCPGGSKAWFTTEPLSNLGTPDDMILQAIDPNVSCPCTGYAGLDQTEFGYKVIYDNQMHIFQWDVNFLDNWFEDQNVSAVFAAVEVTEELATACERDALQVPPNELRLEHESE